VGDSERILVFKDSWVLDRAPLEMPTMFNVDECERETKVCNLLTNGAWDRAALEELFSGELIKRIMKFPLPRIAQEDVLLW